jgi:hypothetical protein
MIFLVIHGGEKKKSFSQLFTSFTGAPVQTWMNPISVTVAQFVIRLRPQKKNVITKYNRQDAI